MEEEKGELEEARESGQENERKRRERERERLKNIQDRLEMETC